MRCIDQLFIQGMSSVFLMTNITDVGHDQKFKNRCLQFVRFQVGNNVNAILQSLRKHVSAFFLRAWPFPRQDEFMCTTCAF